MTQVAAIDVESTVSTFTADLRKLREEIGTMIVGQETIVEGVLMCLLGGGHALLEGVPGLGKTMLVRTLAETIHATFSRIQFTPDLMPADIVGTNVITEESGVKRFEFAKGPIFANIVLADEINRATPKTQSALLEAMSEGRVTVERNRFLLPEPFLVIATQNPLEHQGTFPLPESQLDRFTMSLHLGYPPKEEERELLLSGGVQAILEDLGAVLDRDELVALQQETAGVAVSEKLAGYILDLADATRRGGEFLLGVSTRGAQGLFRAAQALALCEGRRFVVPDDVQRLAVPVLAHRVVLRHGTGGIEAGRDAIERVVAALPVPL